jgi:hypothetical protein
MGLRAGTRATGSVSAQALGASAALSMVATGVSTLANDGVTSRAITVTARDVAGVALEGVLPTIAVSGTGNTATQPVYATNDEGTTGASFTSTGIGVKTISATLGGRTIASTTTVTVYDSAPAIDRTTSVVTVAFASGAAGGATVAVTLQAKDAAGNNLTGGGSTVAFANAGGTSVVSIGATTDVGNGTYTAQITPTTAGTATTLSATIGGAAVTTTMPTFTVTAADVTPWVGVDFSTIANATQLQAASWWYATDYTYFGSPGLTVETSGGPSAGSANFVRANFAVGSGYPGFAVRLPDTTHKEVWVEVWVRFSANFTTLGSGANNPDYKFMFIGNNENVGRWQIKNGTYGSAWSPNHAGGNNDTYLTANAGNGGMFWDGQWHRVRWHAKSSTTISSADGAFEWWLDDVKPYYPANINTNAGAVPESGLWVLQTGINMNKPVLEAMTLDWGAIRIYNTNPGWT